MESDGLAISSTAPAAGATSHDVAALSHDVAALSHDVTALSREQIVALLFDAFNRRELANLLSLLHPEIVFEPMTAKVTQRGEPYRGHKGLERYVEDVEAYWEELTVRPVQIRVAGRAAVALGMVNGRGAAGSFADAPTTWVLKFRDGLVDHVQIFSDARHVFEALVGEDL